jgi:hypothetical protein
VARTSGDAAFYSGHNNLPLSEWQQLANLRYIRIMNHGMGTQMSFALGALLGETMSQVRLLSFETATGGLFEALGCASIGFEFRHFRDSRFQKLTISGQSE